MCGGENVNTSDHEEINEKSLQFLFMEIGRHYTEKCLYQIRNLGLQPCQMPVLMVLSRMDGCSQRRMAELLRNKPSTVNVSIQRLEKNGIVCRRRDEADQRVMRVFLTEEGNRIVGIIKERIREMEAGMYGNFTETELCLLRRFFLQILENVDRMPGPSAGEEKFPDKL